VRFLIVAALVLLARPSHACSIRGELAVDTTVVEEVGRAYSIVVATIDAEHVTENEAIPFLVTEVFKGPLKVGATFSAFGVIDRIPCGGNVFHVGDQYAFYLDAKASELYSHFLRPTDLAQRYVISELVRITASPDRNTELRAAEKHGRGKHAIAEERALADTITRHFSVPSVTKSFAELQPMLKRKDPKVVLAIGLGGDPAARQFMTDLLHRFRGKKPLPREELHAIAAYFAQIKSPSAAEDLAWLFGLMTPDWPWRTEMARAIERNPLP
jgi:hypothetical protein